MGPPNFNTGTGHNLTRSFFFFFFFLFSPLYLPTSSLGWRDLLPHATKSTTRSTSSSDDDKVNVTDDTMGPGKASQPWDLEKRGWSSTK
ncbi:hypothetical protein C1H46_013388 [Malus baccata]|uniref:Uncharacterized protein n=1 Tax=Malus baccata TaxID=106549 RepID=A0A540MPX8_MALBA|nr:hypothetical protein C1H46_013388 [Malus baccata]